jgi:hypothetical protein
VKLRCSDEFDAFHHVPHAVSCRLRGLAVIAMEEAVFSQTLYGLCNIEEILDRFLAFRP